MDCDKIHADYLDEMSTERLIREYVKELLAEDDAADIMAAGAAMSPYGMHYGSSDDLYKIFIKPFTDVIQTTAGKTKEISASTGALAKVAVEAVITTLVPVLRDSYAEIFAHEKVELDRIRKEYASVYKANWDAFFDADVVVAAFFYAPAALLTIEFARKSPKAAAQLVSVLSGGRLDPWLGRVGRKMGWGEKHSTGLGRRDDGPGVPMETVLREDDKEQPDVAAMLAS